jgi:hypothetical protein
LRPGGLGGCCRGVASMPGAQHKGGACLISTQLRPGALADLGDRGSGGRKPPPPESHPGLGPVFGGFCVAFIVVKASLGWVSGGLCQAQKCRKITCLLNHKPLAQLLGPGNRHSRWQGGPRPQSPEEGRARDWAVRTDGGSMRASLYPLCLSDLCCPRGPETSTKGHTTVQQMGQVLLREALVTQAQEISGKK